MKNLLYYSLLVAFVFCILTPASAVNPVTTPVTADSYVIPEGPLAGLTVAEAMTMKPKEIKAKTGQKLRLMERLGLKMLQKKYRKAKESGEEFSPEDARDNLFGIIGISLAGFGLIFSFLFWPIGFIFGVAGLVMGILGLKRDQETAISWAAIGVGGLTVLLSIIAIFVIAL